MKRTTTDRKTPPKKPKTDPIKKRVCAKLYDIGFKKQYIKKWTATINDAVWNEEDYLSDRHMIDDLVDNINQLSSDIDNVLQNMRKIYRIKYQTITSDIRDHYSLKHLVQIIIEYANGAYKPISTKKFLYNETQKSMWFKLKLNDEEFEYYNAVDNKDVRNAIEKLDVKKGNKLFFHATTWKHISTIIKVGPQSTKGRECLDFGINSSFYVTPDINTAISWARKTRFDQEGGIVVFSIDLNECIKIKYKEFRSATADWKRLVKHSRLCEDENNELDFFNFVYGPMLQNSSAILHDPSLVSRAHSPIKWQMASKTVISDAFLRSCMVGAIFLEKPA